MIKCEGYIAYHGDMEITPMNPDIEPFTIYNKDFLYKPDTGYWYGNGRSFPKEIVSGTFEYIEKPDKKCGNSFTISDGVDEVDPCLYDVIETHRNVTVEVLKCCNCGHVEVSWHEDWGDQEV